MAQIGTRRLYNTDESILRGVRESDDGALSHLYKICYPIIRSIILKNSGRLDDIDDILQDGIIIFYEKVKSSDFKLTCSITTFIYSICRNLWLKNLKRKGNSVPISDTHELIDDPGSIEEDEIRLNDNQKTLALMLEKIGDPCRLILLYFYYEQNSMDQIAERLGYTNADNAKNQKYKCLKRLKTMMSDK